MNRVDRDIRIDELVAKGSYLTKKNREELKRLTQMKELEAE